MSPKGQLQFEIQHLDFLKGALSFEPFRP